MRVLVTGGTGFIAAYILRELASKGHTPLPTTRTPNTPGAHLDLAAPTEVARALDAAAPDAIIHAAAMRDLSECEREPARTRVVNTLSTGAIAHWARANSKPLIFLSTDQVFDGKHGNYRETDAPNPINVYGRSKADAETAVLDAGGRVSRVALTLGFSSSGDRSPNEQIATLLRAGKPATLYTNEFRTPVLADDIAIGVVEHLSLSARILHLACPEVVSRYELGVAIARTLSLPTNLCVGATYTPKPSMLPRPPHSTLNSEFTRQTLRTPPRTLAAALESLKNGSYNLY